ncbi:hypothetical protein BsWGS_15384 [Bradybaena similaris]
MASRATSISPNGRPPSTDGRPTSAIGRPTSTDGRPTSTDGRPTSAIGRPTSTDGRPTSAIGRPTSTDGRPTSAIGRPTSAIGRPTSANGRASSANGGPNSLSGVIQSQSVSKSFKSQDAIVSMDSGKKLWDFGSIIAQGGFGLIYLGIILPMYVLVKLVELGPCDIPFFTGSIYLVYVVYSVMFSSNCIQVSSSSY